MINFSVLGKSEGEGKNWHGHVTAVSVAPEFRKMGIASRLMTLLEKTSEQYTAIAVDILLLTALVRVLYYYNSNVNH